MSLRGSVTTAAIQWMKSDKKERQDWIATLRSQGQELLSAKDLGGGAEVKMKDKTGLLRLCLAMTTKCREATKERKSRECGWWISKPLSLPAQG